MAYDLTTEQINSFDDKGYLVLRNRIPVDMIARLRRASDEIINWGLSHLGTGETGRHVAAVMHDGKSFVTRINDLLLNGHPVFLELLGCPQIVGPVASLAGDDRITTYESLLVKNSGDGEVIEWHRDMMYNRLSRIFTLGVYLDESRKGKGAVRIIPTSQSIWKDVCLFEEEWERGEWKAVEIEMNPGDVLVHDVMVVHASPPLAGQERRRTLYFEFRSQAQARTNGSFTSEWIALRDRLMTLAQRRWQRRCDGPSVETLDEWSEEERDLIDRLYTINALIEAGHYCFRSSAIR